MGKYILLITIGASAALSLYAGQLQSAQLDARGEVADRQKLVIARQLARSAYASGVSAINRKFGASLNQCESGADQQSSFELTTHPQPGETVEIRAVGRYGTDGCSCTECPQYAISGEAELHPNGSFSALTIDGPLESVNLAGGGSGPVISGKDAADQQDRNGVSLLEAEDVTRMKDEFCGRSASDVEGVGGGCDVVQDATIDLGPLDEEISNLVDEESTHEEGDLCGKGKGNSGGGSVGSSETPAIVRINNDCKLSGNSGGTGILYVDGGTLTMTGNSEWKGMVLVADEGNFKASKGTPRINGSVGFYGGGSLDMRGTASIQYNSAPLRELQEAFRVGALEDLIESPVKKEVRMINRSQGAVGQGGMPGAQAETGAEN